MTASLMSLGSECKWFPGSALRGIPVTHTWAGPVLSLPDLGIRSKEAVSGDSSIGPHAAVLEQRQEDCRRKRGPQGQGDTRVRPVGLCHLRRGRLPCLPAAPCASEGSHPRPARQTYKAS